MVPDLPGVVLPGVVLPDLPGVVLPGVVRPDLPGVVLEAYRSPVTLKDFILESVRGMVSSPF